VFGVEIAIAQPGVHTSTQLLHEHVILVVKKYDKIGLKGLK
jgi:hypothetical protein